jgi:hypothetical protein
MAFINNNVINLVNANEVPDIASPYGSTYRFTVDGTATAATRDLNSSPPLTEYWWATGARGQIITWNLQGSLGTGGFAPGNVNAVFGRTGNVVPQAGDYNAGQVTTTPAGNFAGTNVQTTFSEVNTEFNRINTFIGKVFGNDLPNFSSNNTVANGDSLETAISKLDAALNVVTTNSVVTFNGRDGAVVPQTSDYDAIQIDFTPTGTITATNTQTAITQLLTQLNNVNSAKADKITHIITPTGTSGLAGGGDLSANRTLAIDIPNTTALGAAPNVNDKLLIYSIANAGLRAVKVSELLDSTTSGLSFNGTWNAATNTPTLNDSDGVGSGAYYKTNTAGTIDLGSGSLSFDIGDWIIYNGTAWEKIDQTDQVTSVNNRQGDVVPQAGDYTGTLIGLDTTNFNNILSPTEDTVQKALDKLDDLSLNNSPLDTTNFNNILSPTENTVQKALDKLDDIDLDSFILNTTNFNNILSPTENTVQKALDKLDDLSLNNSPLDTTNFNKVLSPTEDTVQKALDVLDDAVIKMVVDTTSKTSSFTATKDTIYTNCEPTSDVTYTLPTTNLTAGLSRVCFYVTNLSATRTLTVSGTVEGNVNPTLNTNAHVDLLYVGGDKVWIDEGEYRA